MCAIPIKYQPKRKRSWFTIGHKTAKQRFTTDNIIIIFMGLVAVSGTLAGAFLGAYIGGQKAIELYQIQQKNEQYDIARALYIDISRVEDNLIGYKNISKTHEKNFSDPNWNLHSVTPIYPRYGLFYVYQKDISKLDDKTAIDLYNFYDGMIQHEDRREFIKAVAEKLTSNETSSNVSSLDKHMAHVYTVDLFTNGVPKGIILAEKIKNELKQTYNADTNHPFSF